MYNLTEKNEFRKAYFEEREANKMMEEAGECVAIKEMVTKLSYKPIQTLAERYEYVRISREEGNFEIFEKIANLLAEKFEYYVQDREDDDELCCVYYGNNAYDFDFILLLARFYQNNRKVFDGHFDIISRMCENGKYYRPNWEEIKEFWLKHTLNK